MIFRCTIALKNVVMHLLWVSNVLSSNKLEQSLPSFLPPSLVFVSNQPLTNCGSVWLSGHYFWPYVCTKRISQLPSFPKTNNKCAHSFSLLFVKVHKQHLQSISSLWAMFKLSLLHRDTSKNKSRIKNCARVFFRCFTQRWRMAAQLVLHPWWRCPLVWTC